MQKSIITILLLPCAFVIWAYRYGPKRVSKSVAKSDTVFIERDKTQDHYCKVYIENNRQSIVYKQLIDFKMEKYEKESYNDGLEDLREKCSGALTKNRLKGLPEEWLPLYSYKGKYYVYSPGEEGTEGRRFLTDSTMVYWTKEGPYPVPISSAVAINAQTWHLELHSCSDGARAVNLSIHIIDSKTKMAIWEDDDKPESNRYEFFIPKESVKDFDMIVARCDKIKTAQFGSFDQIDYKALLAGH